MTGAAPFPSELLDSPERLIVHLLPEEERALLRAAAVPRHLTPDVVEAILDDKTARRTLLDHRLLQKASWDVTGETRVLDDGVRDALLESFSDGGLGVPVSDELSKLNERLAAHYADQGEEGLVEALYHRLGWAQAREETLAEVERRVEELLAPGEGEADVAGAHHLIRVLEERSRFGDREAEVLAAELTPRLVRRSRWVQEREATRTYHQRVLEAEAWKLLLDDEERFILQLHAPGGAGKTMFVKNLIGRVCPAEEIPCARIDFDFVAHLVTSTLQPWRVLLLIARQLDRQLEGEPFDDFLRRWGHLETLTYSESLPRRLLAERRRETAPDSDVERAAEVVPEKFRALLTEARGEQPVVVVLDTLENLLHTEGAALLSLVDELARLRAGDDLVSGVSGLKVVLSGRFDLAGERTESWGGADEATVARVEGFRQRYVGDEVERVEVEGGQLELGSRIVTLPLPRFSDPDAEVYLRDQREVADGDMRKAIAEKACGNPMKLALLADAVEQDPTLTAKRIRSWKSAELFYLVDRVIDRILDPKVQWLVRWGVVPWRLTRDFVDRVLWPLFREHHGGEVFDRPEAENEDEDLRSPVTGAERYPKVDPGDDPESVWRRLTLYAAEASWVSAERDLPDALSFHPEVRDPMRGLLRRHDQRIYHELNRRALAYFEELAGGLAGPERASALRGVVFHAFEPWRGRPADPGQEFSRALDRLGTDQALRAALAREVLDVERRALREDREDLEAPSGAVLGRAHAEIARHLADEVEREPGLASQLRSHLAQARLPEGTRSWLEGRALIAEGRQDEARERFSFALDDDSLAAEEKDEIRLSVGTSTGDGSLLEAAASSGDGGVSERATRELAELHYRREDYERAAESYAEIGDLAGQARCLTTLGRPAAAEELVSGLSSPERRQLQALVDLGLHRPLRVLRSAGTASPEALEEMRDSTSPGRRDAAYLAERWMRILRIRAQMMLSMDDEALSALESMIDDLRDVDLAVLAARTAARLALRRDEPAAARAYIERLPPDLPSDLTVRAHLLDVEARARMGLADEVHDLLEELEDEDAAGWLPSTRAAVALARLQILGADREGLKRLSDLLRDVGPASRRLFLLSRLRRVGAAVEVDRRVAEGLLGGTELSLGDGPGLVLARAELLRVLGRGDEARDLLAPLLPPDAETVTWRLARLAFDRLGWPAALLEQPDPPKSFPSTFRERVMQEHAERRADPPGYAGRRGLGPLLGPADDGDLSFEVGGGTAVTRGVPEETVMRGGSLGVEASPPSTVPGFFLKPELDPERFEWWQLAQAGAGRAFDDKLVYVLAKEWREVFAGLGESILPPEVLSRLEARSEPTDLVIPHGDDDLAWVPWQLATVGGMPITELPGVRSVLRLVPDVPSSGAPALGEPTAVAVIGSHPAMLKMARRGDRTWRKAAARVEVSPYWSDPWDPELGVFHLVANLEERRGGSVVLLLKSEYGDSVGPSQLARSLAPQAQRTPLLVILDVPWPGSRAETAHQLLLREVFAWRLAREAPEINVLATGFGEADQASEWLPALIDALTAGVPLAEVASRLQRLPAEGDAFASQVVARGTTLYTGDARRVVQVRRRS